MAFSRLTWFAFVGASAGLAFLGPTACSSQPTASSSASTALQAVGKATALEFLDLSSDAVATTCSGSFFVQTVDAAGNAMAPASRVDFTLSSASTVGGFVTFYSGPKCATRLLGSTIDPGSPASPRIYFKRDVASNTSITLTATDKASVLTPASSPVTIAPDNTFATPLDQWPGWYKGATNIPSPKTGVVNVKAYGAVGDGKTDDTGAILFAIWSNVGQFETRTGKGSAGDATDAIIYFPKGTYLISRPLLWMDAGTSKYSAATWQDNYGTGNWVSELSMQGENKTDTVIRYKDATQKPLHAKTSCWENAYVNSVLYTASFAISKIATYLPSQCYDDPDPGNPNHCEGGETNDAFRNHIQNLTIDIGMGNPHLVGIDYVGSNNTRIDNVNIVSGDRQGCVGLSTWRFSEGPELFTNVFIGGFDTGFLASGEMQFNRSTGTYDPYGSPKFSTLEHVRLQDQNVAGAVLPGMAEGGMRDIESDQSLNGNVPAFAITNSADLPSESTNSLAIVDSSFVGSGATAAIALLQDGAAPMPEVFLRNSVSKGYSALLSENGTAVSGISNELGNEWESMGALFLAGHGGTASLNLPTSETPVFQDDTGAGTSYANWAFLPNNCSNTESGVTDCTTMIQAALDDATKSTVVIPWGWYGISSPLSAGVNDSSNAKRILGLGAHFVALPSKGSSLNEAPLFDIVDIQSGGTLWLDGIDVIYRPGPLGGPEPAHFGDSESPFPVYGLSSTGTFVPVLLNQANKTTLVLRDIDNVTYLNEHTAGVVPAPVYLESVAYGPFVFVDQPAYARNLDPEVAPASEKFFECNSTSTGHNEPADFLQQGYSHAIASGAGAQLWVLGLKTENREWPSATDGGNATGCDFTKTGSPSNHDGADVPSNSLLEVDYGASAEVIGLQTYDHRVNSTDTLGNPTGAIRAFESKVSVEGYFAGGGSNNGYSVLVQQFYETKNSQLFESWICSFHGTCQPYDGILVSGAGYSNGGSGSSFPIYIGY
jgi:hypothetical protein